MCTFPSHLLGVLCSCSLIDVLFKSTLTDLHVSWDWVTGWLEAVKSEFPREEQTAVSAALPTASLGGKVFGRRSGRPACMTGVERGGKTLNTLLWKKHFTSWYTLKNWISEVISTHQLFPILQWKLPFSPFSCSYRFLLQCLPWSQNCLLVGVKAAGCCSWFGSKEEAQC